MEKTSKLFPLYFVLFMLCLLVGSPAYSKAPDQDAKPKFTVAWSIYVGWMPWPYAEQSGILKKWADAYGIEINLKQMDYKPSVEAYVAKQVDAVTITNMEMLDNPAAAGIDSTAIILGDFSNGNDAICTVGIPSVKDLKGNTISIVELSVSHYLLARALEKHGLKESDVRLVNTSDSDIATTFLTNAAKKRAVVTWNPMVMQVAQAPNVKTLFTSAEVPGEILDLMVVRTDVLQKNPQLGKALTGAWYEMMDLMGKRGPEADAAMAVMAKLSGCSLTEFKGQLATTAMFYTPRSAHDYMTGEEIRTKMEFVRQFCFDHKLLGDKAASPNVVGITYPDGTLKGSGSNTTMRFDASFTKMALDGQLRR